MHRPVGRHHHRTYPQRTAHKVDRVAVRADAIKIRAAVIEDSDEVASLCAEVFGRNNFPGVESEALKKLEDRLAEKIVRQTKEQVQTSLQKKAVASVEHRQYRLQRSAMLMRAQLALLQGQKAVLPTQPTPEQRRAEQKWIRARQYTFLVAEDTTTQQLVGGVLLSLYQPEAILPPPFPSTAPLRAYVSAMGVKQEWRRKGIARGLLRACLRTARLWGHDSLWLHVNKSKEGAQKLYEREGFQPAKQRSPIPTVLQLSGELLLCKQLEPLQCDKIDCNNSNALQQQQQQAAQAAAEAAMLQ